MRWAFELARRFLPDYSSASSRHDFTQPQLFACLVVREHQKKSYRGVQALIEDCPQWRADIGLSRTPDHNTLCRAFHELVKPKLVNRMLDPATRQSLGPDNLARLGEAVGLATHHAFLLVVVIAAATLAATLALPRRLSPIRPAA